MRWTLAFLIVAGLAFNVGAQQDGGSAPPGPQAPQPPAAAGSGRLFRFKVSKYHIKSKKSFWDSKNSLMEAGGDVVITLSLDDGTTAYIYCDQAKDYRALGKGEAWGHVKIVRDKLTIESEQAFWDMGKRETLLEKSGFLLDRDFMGGTLAMDFTRMFTEVASDFALMTFTSAKGRWESVPGAHE